jgi:hypothetical protein
MLMVVDLASRRVVVFRWPHWEGCRFSGGAEVSRRCVGWEGVVDGCDSRVVVADGCDGGGGIWVVFRIHG